MESTPMERFTLTADDGVTLAAVRWGASDQKGRPLRAVLELSHGMSEYAARYAPFASACAAAGIAVYGHDHRGHGGSIDTSTPLGHFADSDGFSKVVGDLHTVHRYIRGAHPGVPLFLFGHSMGSFLVRAYLLAHASVLSGAIISATGWRMGPINRALQWVARREVQKHGARAPSRLMAKLAFGSFNLQFMPARTSFDWLSRDPNVVDAYIADPLCGFDCTGKLWDDLLGGIHHIEKEEDDASRLSTTLPILLIAGGRDAVSIGGFASGQVAARYKAAGNPNITDRRYPGARHELVNETIRDEVFADLITWMEQSARAIPVTATKAKTGATSAV
jgi:alpha-beta hydrolase superfamily lysophospholipase